ncbi:MAG: aminotransferase class I/II-fold pyridoxal phosphate-dependent enzyme [Bdellovibrionales bacterium]|nr:aminotransferase class I/II-fold pyridoxal phosphate-dependent enzyme [Bdellovibrionales bacterium]
MNSIEKRCAEYKDAKTLQKIGLYPFFRPMTGSEGRRVNYGGKQMVMLGSNNYLGLTHEARVKQAAKDAIDKYGTGCTGSRFLNGNSDLHEQLETSFAKFFKKEAALVMTTGFLTNYTGIGTLVEKGDFILSDSENHASIIAGCRNTQAKTVVFNHNDMVDLEKKLAEIPAEATKLIVVDGVFSMTGELAKLPEIVALKKKVPNTWILVDDAHGLGAIGATGRGTAEFFGLEDEIDLITATFSKAMASLGGVIAGKKDVIHYLRHRARGFIFSAALPTASAAAVLKVLELIESEPQHLKKLAENIEYLKNGYKNLGLPVLPSQSPILSIWIGDEVKSLKVVAALADLGVFATPVLFPAVPFGNAIIRTSLMASHSKEDLDFALDAWSKVADQLQLRVEAPSTDGLHSRAAGYSFEKFA